MTARPRRLLFVQLFLLTALPVVEPAAAQGLPELFRSSSPDSLPGVQASCGGTATSPFTFTITPAVVNAGQNYTLSWCDPSYTSGAYGFTNGYYRLYMCTSACTFYPWIADYASSTQSITFPAAAADIGKTFYYRLGAHGTLKNIIGTYEVENYPTTNPTVQIVASGGGGGGGGGGGSFTPCVSDATTLCLHSNRFKVTASYVAGGTPGQGKAVKLAGADDSGYFWFFDASNMEIVAKIASFCSGSSGNYGFYVSGLTDVQVDVTLTDMKDGTIWHKLNPAGANFCKDAQGGFSCP